MRVFYVIDSFELGGAQTQLLHLVRHLDGDEYRLAVCPLWHIMTLEPQFAQSGVEIVRVHKRFQFDLRVVLLLAQRMRKFRPDVVHTWLFTGSLWGCLAARLAGVPAVVAGVRTLLPEERYPWYFWAVNRLLSRLSHRMTVNCWHGLQELPAHGIPAGKVRLIHNGVDTHLFWRARLPGHVRVSLRESLGIAQEKVVVGTIGRLTLQKGQDVLLRAVRRAWQAGADLVCLVIGTGPDREQLEKTAGALGLSGRVQFLGERSDIPDLLSAMDVFVLSSWWEGMPNVVLEAMAMELPVVATAVPGTAEAVVDGVTGLLALTGDVESLADKLYTLANDPARRAAMGKAGRQRCLKEFSLQEMVRRTTDLYQELIRGAGRKEK